MPLLACVLRESSQSADSIGLPDASMPCSHDGCFLTETGIEALVPLGSVQYSTRHRRPRDSQPAAASFPLLCPQGLVLLTDALLLPQALSRWQRSTGCCGSWTLAAAR